MGLLALTDWLDSPISVAMVIVASVITVSDNGLAFTAIAEIAGPFWSGRALGTQNTSQLLTAGVAPPLFGGLIGVAGYAAAFAVCALFPVARDTACSGRCGPADQRSRRFMIERRDRERGVCHSCCANAHA